MIKWIGTAVVVVLLLATGYSLWSMDTPAVEIPEPDELTTVSETSVRRVREFCAGCHATPEPDLFPADAWHAEVVRGYRFYAQSGKHDLDPPPIEEAVRYYVSNAPADLQMPRSEVENDSKESASIFRGPESIHSPFHMQSGIGHVTRGFHSRQILAADMASGHLWLAEWQDNGFSLRSVVQLEYPCRLQWSDLDADGMEDLLVADLGAFYADDRRGGSIVWLRRSGPESFDEPLVLLDGIGRACDVRTADFDGDGKLDLAVAEFGWLHTGGIHLLIQLKPEEDGRLQFEHRILDDRAGAVHLLPDDVDQDGRLDLLALISQQYEQILLFEAVGSRDLSDNPSSAALLPTGGERQGDSQMGSKAVEPKVLWQAPDPGYGSNGLQQVDFDGDGDLDLLYTHGDTFDGPYVKPSHGVHWLENQGDLNFLPHRLLSMAGAYSAQAVDWDLDGDLDVAVSAWLPKETHRFDRQQAVSLVLLERSGDKQFSPRILERGNPSRSSIFFEDLDGDGDLDLIAGRDEEALDQPALLDVWWNQTVP